MTAPLCPLCHGAGYTSVPYIAGVVSVTNACPCPAGKAFVEEMKRQMKGKK